MFILSSDMTLNFINFIIVKSEDFGEKKSKTLTDSFSLIKVSLNSSIFEIKEEAVTYL